MPPRFSFDSLPGAAGAFRRSLKCCRAVGRGLVDVSSKPGLSGRLAIQAISRTVFRLAQGLARDPQTQQITVSQMVTAASKEQMGRHLISRVDRRPTVGVLSLARIGKRSRNLPSQVSTTRKRGSEEHTSELQS